MPEFTEHDLSLIERDRDLPPDEPYDGPGRPDDEECPVCGSEDLEYAGDGQTVCGECGARWDE